MSRIVIGIPTYKRPVLLEKLINSIYDCDIDKNFISTIDILVVDNDIAKTAEFTTSKFVNNGSENFKLHYHKYSKKGLSNVRNKIIEKAFEFEPDYIVFVDDDEYVTENWLNELIYCMVKNNCDMAMGPVIPEFEKKVSTALSIWYLPTEYKNHQNLDFIMTGNLIMRSNFLHKHKLRFDPRFNTIGGEDSYFGIYVLKKGGTINYASKAVVYEHISEKRSSLKWLLQRRFNGANTFTYIMILEKDYIQVLKKIIISLIYLLVGVVCLLLLPFKFKYRYLGLAKVVEGMGGFSGLLNIKFNQYSNNNR